LAHKKGSNSTLYLAHTKGTNSTQESINTKFNSYGDKYLTISVFPIHFPNSLELRYLGLGGE